MIGETPEGVDPLSSRLQADRCDLLPKSGCVDPLPSLRPSERDIVSSSNLQFPDSLDGMSSFGNVNREDVAQYARLVGRQLRSGKVVLSDYAAAGGTMLAVSNALRGTKGSLAWDPRLRGGGPASQAAASGFTRSHPCSRNTKWRQSACLEARHALLL